MPIEKNQVVSFHYRLTEEGGEALESSYDADPVVYLHGHNNMLAGMEDALTGREVGDSFEATLTPEQAYGQRKEGETQRVPMKHLLTKGKIKKGMIVQINTEHGGQEALVVKVGLKNVDVDANHPYAGKTLVFAMEVLDVREATGEELAHGHVHAAGGCGH